MLIKINFADIVHNNATWRKKVACYFVPMKISPQKQMKFFNYLNVDEYISGWNNSKKFFFLISHLFLLLFLKNIFLF